MLRSDVVAEAARQVFNARLELTLCPAHNELWRSLSVKAEQAWQTLYEVSGRNTAAALFAIRHVAGQP